MRSASRRPASSSGKPSRCRAVDDARLGDAESQTAAIDGGRHEQDQERTHPVVAEALPHSVKKRVARPRGCPKKVAPVAVTMRPPCGIGCRYGSWPLPRRPEDPTTWKLMASSASPGWIPVEVLLAAVSVYSAGSRQSKRNSTSSRSPAWNSPSSRLPGGCWCRRRRCRAGCESDAHDGVGDVLAELGRHACRHPVAIHGRGAGFARVVQELDGGDFAAPSPWRKLLASPPRPSCSGLRFWRATTSPTVAVDDVAGRILPPRRALPASGPPGAPGASPDPDRATRRAR